MANFATLTDRALIRMTGEEAGKFLQALITCDVEHLSPGEGNFGALLTPQGKIMFDFFVVRTPEGFLIDVAADKRDELIKRLNFYKLRAKLDITPEDDATKVFAAWDGEAGETDGMAFVDPRMADMGYRLYASEPPQGTEGYYAAHRIALGMPEGGQDYEFGDTFPHEALMDQFGGVDFVKGCYVGQEVVSRMQHRGTARKRVVMVSGDGHLPGAGTPVEAGGKTAGVMGSSHGVTGLAMLRLDRVNDAMKAGEAITAGGETLTVKLQPWVNFGWPEN